MKAEIRKDPSPSDFQPSSFLLHPFENMHREITYAGRAFGEQESRLSLFLLTGLVGDPRRRPLAVRRRLARRPVAADLAQHDRRLPHG
ncbi:MAG: hypothetical protein U0797_10920 [Gemmataceae bacterium]